MNLLSVSLQQSILALAANGWSARRIARELNVHRETVGRWVRLAKPATVATVNARVDLTHLCSLGIDPPPDEQNGRLFGFGADSSFGWVSQGNGSWEEAG